MFEVSASSLHVASSHCCRQSVLSSIVRNENKRPTTANLARVATNKEGEKIPEFSRLFQSHNYTFREVIATKILAIWQHLGRFLATFSLHMCKDGWYLLGRVATPWDHNDPVYPVNSCFTQLFDRTKIILFVIIFPQGCTEFPENSMRFPGSENSLSIPRFQVFPGLWPPCWPLYEIRDTCSHIERERGNKSRQQSHHMASFPIIIIIHTIHTQWNSIRPIWWHYCVAFVTNMARQTKRQTYRETDRQRDGQTSSLTSAVTRPSAGDRGGTSNSTV